MRWACFRWAFLPRLLEMHYRESAEIRVPWGEEEALRKPVVVWGRY